jgi:hypothetical protein
MSMSDVLGGRFVLRRRGLAMRRPTSATLRGAEGYVF